MLACYSNTLAELRICDAGSEAAHPSSETDFDPLALRTSSSNSETSCLAPHTPSGEIDDHATIFECNICTQISQDPVATMCGHLFCWPCLYFRLSLDSACKACPVCKADVQGKIVPLYGCGRGGFVAEKFRGIHIPCRPSTNTHSTACAQREPQYHAVQHVNRTYGRYNKD